MVITFAWVSRRIRPSGDGIAGVQTRGRFAQLLETMCAFVRDEIARPNLHHLTDKYIPYIWTIFFFILFSNLLGLLPVGYVLQLVTGDPHYSHWGGTATSNLALNLVLAFLSFVAIIVIGIRESGAKDFFNHFNPLGWELILPGHGLKLQLMAALDDQEMITIGSTGVTYWEGSVSVSGQSGAGSVTGRGYMELTGYADPYAPPL